MSLIEINIQIEADDWDVLGPSIFISLTFKNFILTLIAIINWCTDSGGKFRRL